MGVFMALDKTIFGLRFGSDETLYPAPADRTAIPESPNMEGERGQRDDLTRYRELLERLSAFERHRHQQQGASPQNLRERMFYGVIGLSQFVNPVLKSEVELYKYYMNQLIMLDIKKPVVFIKGAEEEISRLNPKRKKDADKLNRLQGMVEERKLTLDALLKHSAALVKELTSIAMYIRSNLVKIGKLCEASIVILMELQMNGKMESRLIDELVADSKDGPNDVLQQDLFDRQDRDMVHDVDTLAREMSVLVREDLYAISALYEAIYDHTKKIVRELDIRMAEMESRSNRSFDEDCAHFTRIEQALVSLVSDYHFDLKPRTVSCRAEHENLLTEKRHEMIEYIFEVLSSERRIRAERRSDENRRRFDDPENKPFERRQRTDRSGKDRRDAAASAVSS
jgi:hypothetical protein